MLTVKDSFTGFSVDDIAAAQEFYGKTLGLSATLDDMGILSLDLPGGHTIVYPKKDHVPATFTVLNFEVDDIDAAVDQLADAGVTLEFYEGAYQDDLGVVRGLAAGQGPDIAWFTDPAGNILSIIKSA